MMMKRDKKMKYKLYNGDCLEMMDKLIEEGIKVDMVLTDPPYGTTACKWDNVISFDAMWERLNKLIKFNELSYDFMTRLFSFLKLNKTTSTANVGRGELILALLIKNATVDGLDDLKINDNNFNVKYISPFRQKDNAMIYYTGQNNST
jgi:predicted RNA methylase